MFFNFFQDIDELWTTVAKDSEGVWRVDGDPLTKFEAEWGENEPINTPGADCASFSKSKDYKLKAAGKVSSFHKFQKEIDFLFLMISIIEVTSR